MRPWRRLSPGDAPCVEAWALLEMRGAPPGTKWPHRSSGRSGSPPARKDAASFSQAAQASQSCRQDATLESIGRLDERATKLASRSPRARFLSEGKGPAANAEAKDAQAQVRLMGRSVRDSAGGADGAGAGWKTRMAVTASAETAACTARWAPSRSAGDRAFDQLSERVLGRRHRREGGHRK